GYRQRIVDLIEGKRAYARIIDGRVVFKAELAVVTKHTAQVQGVWVDPAYRGHGLAVSGMAAVVRDALRRVAPTVSLYANDFNEPARRAYARTGFRQLGTFAPVLFCSHAVPIPTSGTPVPTPPPAASPHGRLTPRD